MPHRSTLAAAAVAVIGFGSIAQAVTFNADRTKFPSGLDADNRAPIPDATASGPTVTSYPITISSPGNNVGNFDGVAISSPQIQRFGDFIIEIVAPNGTAVTLAAPSALDNSVLTGFYTFSNNATSGATTTLAEESILDNPTNEPGYIIYTGTYFPAGPGAANDTVLNPGTPSSFAPFVGLPLSGTWNLRFTDRFVGNNYYDPEVFGTAVPQRFATFSLSVTPVAVPEPASLSLLGLGGVALLRRARRA